MASTDDIIRIAAEVRHATGYTPFIIGSASLVLRGLQAECKDIDLLLPAAVGTLSISILPYNSAICPASIYFHRPAADIYIDTFEPACYPDHGGLQQTQMEFIRRVASLQEWETVGELCVLTPRSYYWCLRLGEDVLGRRIKRPMHVESDWEALYWERQGLVPPDRRLVCPPPPPTGLVLAVAHMVYLNERIPNMAPDLVQRVYAAKLKIVRFCALHGYVSKHGVHTYGHFCTPCHGEGGGCRNCGGRGQVTHFFVKFNIRLRGGDYWVALPESVVDFPLCGETISIDTSVWSRPAFDPCPNPDLLIARLEDLVEQVEASGVGRSESVLC